MINALRSTGGVWKNIHLLATPEQIGIREGRRLHGLYTLSVDDLKEGRRFEDGICHVTFNVDVHSLDPDKHKEMEEIPWQMKPYDIPLRSLISKDVDGLMFAGRCISGSFMHMPVTVSPGMPLQWVRRQEKPPLRPFERTASR